MKIKFIIMVFVIIWLILIARIYFISIKSNKYYEELAKQNTIKVEKLNPVRGVILDRNGEPLAVNKLGFSIKIKPHLSYKTKIEILDKELDNIINIFPTLSKEKLSKDKLKKNYIKKDSPYNHKFITIIDFISHQDMLPHYSKLILNENLEIAPSTKRFYPNKSVASHLIGYVSKANDKEFSESETTKLTGIVGKIGLEKYYNRFLEGEYGYKKIKITAFNQEIEEMEKKIPIENRNLTLTIDIRLQNLIHQLFEFEEKSGVVVVMNAKNGEILAAGSFPEFDINNFIGGISKEDWDALITDLRHPFTNKIVNGLYPPGSVVKMGVALSFLENGINENSSVFCTGEFQVGNRKFRCWKHWGHGNVALVDAIRESCDDYFYKNSLKVGIENIANTLNQLGLGQKTGIDLPNEWSGVVPSKSWKFSKYSKAWHMGETLISSIGQGYFLTTPIQIARYMALIATGTLPTPHLVKFMANEEVKNEPKDVLSEFQKNQLPLLRKGMYQVVNHPNGTAFRHLKTKVKVAGKTGTAQVVGIPQEEKKRMKEKDMEYYRRSHAWLSVYAPANNPQYVITALVEHGGHGGEATGGIISEVVNKLVELGYIAKESE